MSDSSRAGRLIRTVPWLTAFIAVNSGYLLVAGSPSVVYVSNVLLHIGLGLLLVLAWGATAASILWGTGERRGLTDWVLISGMTMAAVSGLALIRLGALLEHRWLVWLHALAGLGAALATVAWLDRRQRMGRRSAPWKVMSLAVLVSVGAVAIGQNWPELRGQSIRNPGVPPATLADEAMDGAEGPFFPSAAATSDGELIPARFFLDSNEACGRPGCHVEVAEQWESSAHHFSSFNNQFYRKSIEYMQEVAGVRKPQWCAGCHDPALLFSGQMAQPVSEFIGLPEAHAGLACVACHSVVQVKNTMGNGSYVIEYPALHELAENKNPVVRAVHDFLVRVNPKPHRNTFLKPFFREQPAEYCSACHKVHLDKEVNNYRWIRGFNSYDNWQASGVSGQGARSFYEPPEGKTCVTCHMPLVPSGDPANKQGYIRSHRFAVANSALPEVNRDTTQARAVEAFLKNGQLRVDVFAVSEPEELPPPFDEAASGGTMPQLSSTFAVADEAGMELGAGSLTTRATPVFGALEDGAGVLRRGSSVRVDVVVRTVGLGHLFPSGTVDAQEAWLEFHAVDSRGDTLFWSGWVGEGGAGTVDPGAHFYRNLMVDARGNAVNKRNAFHARSVVYVNLIPPGAANVAHYRLYVPKSAGDTVTLTARLHYRKFNRFYTQFSYAGARDPSVTNPEFGVDFDDGPWGFTGDPTQASGPTKEIPTLPIITMAEDAVRLRVVDAGPMHEPSVADTAQARMRWNDYGIGLLLEGDLKTAEHAFERAVELEPGYADGWVNLARVYLQEGALERAREVLDVAERVRPGFHKAAYFRGLYHKASGEYPEALSELMSVSERFPRDRVVLNDIGRVYFLNYEPAKAIPYLERVLQIDSEDLAAHYNLMLCYRGVGDLQRSAVHEQRYRRYKADEDTQIIARQYRKAHPDDNNEAQPIHEHRSTYGKPLDHPRPPGP